MEKFRLQPEEAGNTVYPDTYRKPDPSVGLYGDMRIFQMMGEENS